MKSLLSSYDKGQIIAAIGKELYASMLYKDIANKLQKLGYFGAQKYFLKESADELTHYQMWVDYCNDRLDVASVPMIPAQKAEVSSIGDALVLAMNTEIDLADFYDKFYEETECYYTRQRLLEFLEIQRKSIGEYGDLIAKLQIIGNERSGLLIFDSQI
jgi:ferritin